MPISVGHYGNISAASTLILLDEDRRAGRVPDRRWWSYPAAVALLLAPPDLSQAAVQVTVTLARYRLPGSPAEGCP